MKRSAEGRVVLTSAAVRRLVNPPRKEHVSGKARVDPIALAAKFPIMVDEKPAPRFAWLRMVP